MQQLAKAIIALIGILHVWIFVLESFFWETPRGRRAFRLTPERAAITAPLAKNQGVYNSFLALGLFWSLIAPEPAAFQLKVFFLACVAVAGIVGGLTVSKSIYFVQTVPACLALILLFFA